METINNTDRQSSLFIGDRENAFFSGISTELIECVTQQKIRYYSIDSDRTVSDDLYGESTQKVFRKPLEVYALVLYNSPLIDTGTFSTETSYSLKIYIQKFRVEQDLKMTPKMGDFIEFANHYYELTKVYEPQLIAGQDVSGFRMGIYCDAISTRSDVFAPNKISPTDPHTNPDTIR